MNVVNKELCGHCKSWYVSGTGTTARFPNVIPKFVSSERKMVKCNELDKYLDFTVLKTDPVSLEVYRHPNCRKEILTD